MCMYVVTDFFMFFAIQCTHARSWVAMLYATHCHVTITTTNVTGRHRALKQKLRAGY